MRSRIVLKLDADFSHVSLGGALSKLWALLGVPQDCHSNIWVMEVLSWDLEQALRAILVNSPMKTFGTMYLILYYYVLEIKDFLLLYFSIWTTKYREV